MFILFLGFVLAKISLNLRDHNKCHFLKTILNLSNLNEMY